jgi:hypothetical protein
VGLKKAGWFPPSSIFHVSYTLSFVTPDLIRGPAAARLRGEKTHWQWLNLSRKDLRALDAGSRPA